MFFFSAYDQADGYTLYSTEGELDVCKKGESQVGGRADEGAPGETAEEEGAA